MFIYCLFPSYSAKTQWSDLTSPILLTWLLFLFLAAKGTVVGTAAEAAAALLAGGLFGWFPGRGNYEIINLHPFPLQGTGWILLWRFFSMEDT